MNTPKRTRRAVITARSSAVARRRRAASPRLGWLAAGAAALLLLAPSSSEATQTYKLDTAHSAIIFRVAHFGVGFTYGRFRSFSGSFTLDEKNPASSSVALQVDAASVYTADKKRDKHLRSPDFFNVKLHPSITFSSTKVRRSGKTWHVTGKLSLHGVSRTVTAKMKLVGSGKDPWGNHRAGFEGELWIKRSQFGMAGMIGPAGDEIKLLLAFEGIKQ